MTFTKYRTLFLASALTLATATPALAASYIMPIQEGNVSYLSGGIGDDERAALKDEAKGYNLKVVNSNRKGEFTADNNLVIENKNGREMVNVNDGGPLLYVKLPAGTYTIEATNGGQNQKRTITVGDHKPADIHLIWQGQS